MVSGLEKVRRPGAAHCLLHWRLRREPKSHSPKLCCALIGAISAVSQDELFLAALGRNARTRPAGLIERRGDRLFLRVTGCFHLLDIGRNRRFGATFLQGHVSPPTASSARPVEPVGRQAAGWAMPGWAGAGRGCWIRPADPVRWGPAGPASPAAYQHSSK